jgi:hypothetical protein
MGTRDAFAVNSEDDAWELLDLWLQEKPIKRLEFGDWPKLNLKLNGAAYKSSLHSGQMEALVDFQMAMGRAYAAIAHGAYDKRRLRADEEEQLEFTTKFRGGSSILETDLSPLVNAMSQVVVSHPIESLIAVTAVALVLVSRSMVLKHYDTKAKQIEADERKKLVSLLEQTTNLDRKRWSIMDKVVERLAIQYPALEKMIPDLSHAYWRLASSSTDAETLEVEGVVLDSDHLTTLSERRTRRPTKKRIVTEVFAVEGITKIRNTYRVQMKSETYHFAASFAPPAASPLKVRQLLRCLAQSRSISAKVEIKEVEKSVVLGKLLSFKPIAPPKE